MRFEEILETRPKHVDRLAAWAQEVQGRKSQAQLIRDRDQMHRKLREFSASILRNLTYRTDPLVSRPIVINRNDGDADTPTQMYAVARLTEQECGTPNTSDGLTDIVVQVFDVYPVSKELIDEGLLFPRGAEHVGPGLDAHLAASAYKEYVGFRRGREEVWHAGLDDWDSGALSKDNISPQALTDYFVPRAETAAGLALALTTFPENIAKGDNSLPGILKQAPLSLPLQV